MSPRFTTLLIVALVLGAAAPALGQAASDAEAASADGVRLAGEERWAEAVSAFRTSLSLAPRPEAACNLGLALERWGEHASEAADAYSRCAALDEDGTYRDHALERADAMRSQAEADAAQAPENIDEPPPITTTIPIVEARRSRSRTFLWVGLATAVVGAALTAGGAVAAGNASDADEALRARYPDGEIPATDAESVRQLDDAEQSKAIGLGLYVGGGILLAVGATLIVLDLTGATDSRTVRVAASPTMGGGHLSAHVTF